MPLLPDHFSRLVEADPADLKRAVIYAGGGTLAPEATEPQVPRGHRARTIGK